MRMRRKWMNELGWMATLLPILKLSKTLYLFCTTKIVGPIASFIRREKLVPIVLKRLALWVIEAKIYGYCSKDTKLLPCPFLQRHDKTERMRRGSREQNK